MLTKATSSIFAQQFGVGNKVKLTVKTPNATITGIVEGCDSFGTLVLSEHKTTLLPLSAEEQQKRDAELAEMTEDERENFIAFEKEKEAAFNLPADQQPKLQLVLSDRIVDVDILSTPETGSRPIRQVFTDALPRKRVFVSDVDTLLGKAICQKFGAAHDWEISGTKSAVLQNTLDVSLDDQQQQQQQKEQKNEQQEQEQQRQGIPSSVSSVVPSFREDPVAFKTAVLRADLIICPLRDDTNDASAALRILSNSGFENEKVYILVSSVLTWAQTAQAIKAKQEADLKAEKEENRKYRIENGEDPDDDEEDEENEENINHGGEENEEDLEPPPTFSDGNDHERVPHSRYQHWRLIEQATKFANSESLHTYVFTAGMLYGAGEESLHDLFMAAWHREPLPIVSKIGQNVIPTVHVNDLATAIFNAGNSEEVQPNRYMLATDNGNNTSAEIIESLAKAMGDPNHEPVFISEPPFLGAASRWFDTLSLDLRIEAGNFGSLLSDEEWVSQGGLVENMVKVTSEFKTLHTLTPLRVALVGQPDSGKTELAKWICNRYELEYVNVDVITKYYEQHRQEIFKKLLAHREKRRIQAKKREEEEAAAENAEGASAISGATSNTSGGMVSGRGGRQPPPKTRRSTTAGGQQDADDEADLEDFDEDEALNADGWEVEFAVAAPPPAPSRQSNTGSEDYTGSDVDGEGGSRPTSSRASRPINDDDTNYDDELEQQKKKAKIPPEVSAAEDLEEDDDEDEVLVQLKEDLRLCNKVWSLKTLQTMPTTAADQVPTQSERFIDHALAVMARYKLQNSAQSKNQGYVLDGFPKTTRQASLTFAADAGSVIDQLPEWEEDEETGERSLPEELVRPLDPNEDADAASLLEHVDPDLMLEYAIVMDASDAVILSRASDTGKNSQSRLERLYRRLAFSQTYNSALGKPSISVQSWLRAILTNADNAPSRSVAVMSLDTDVAWPVTGTAAISQVEAFLGKPHVIHPTAKEIEDEQRQAEEQSVLDMETKAETDAIEQQRQEEEEARRQAIAASHKRRLETCADEGKAAAAVCSIPAQAYLTDYIAAPLSSCVASVARVRPQDPLGVLADALYQYDAPIVHAKEILTSNKKTRSGSGSGESPMGTPRNHD